MLLRFLPAKGTLAREIVAMLLVKGLLILLLWGLFFSPAHRPVVNEAILQQTLLNPE